MVSPAPRIARNPDWAGGDRRDEGVQNSKDRTVSRRRYWGIPIPIWERAQGHRRVMLGRRFSRSPRDRGKRGPPPPTDGRYATPRAPSLGHGPGLRIADACLLPDSFEASPPLGRAKVPGANLDIGENGIHRHN
ncbi:MAG: hypothetical protein ACE5KI_08310 [Dehalococcoidia bacterium]